MNSLLAYGSSSSSENEEENTDIDQKPVEAKVKLPKPALGGSQASLNTSVFTNPFVQEELAKAAILEKHVKMVSGTDQMQIINGKKICWNFRKGRCRFGHNCKYAHDTDIQKTSEEIESEKQKINGISHCSGEFSGNSSSHVPPMFIEETSSTSDEIWEGGQDRKKLKRPGLSKGLIPAKRVLEMYKKQKTNQFNKTNR